MFTRSPVLSCSSFNSNLLAIPLAHASLGARSFSVAQWRFYYFEFGAMVLGWGIQLEQLQVSYYRTTNYTMQVFGSDA